MRRLSEAIRTDSFDDGEAWNRLRNRYLRVLRQDKGRGVTVGIDYFDTEHRFANPEPGEGMAGAVRCWDGSRHEKAVGIPHVIIEADTPGGQRIPLTYLPYDRLSPDYKSDPVTFLDAINDVRYFPGDEAIWVADRGFDSASFFAELDQRGLLWSIRLRVKVRRGKRRADADPNDIASPDTEDSGADEDDDSHEDDPSDIADAEEEPGSPDEQAVDVADKRIPSGGRLLIDEDGVVASAREHADDAVVAASRVEQRARDLRRRKGPRRVDVCTRIVRLVKGGRSNPKPVGPWRTLIAVFTEGYRAPLVLLASRPLMTADEVLRFYRAYPKRWLVEEAVRHAKNRSGWGLSYEDARVLGWQAVLRMAFFACAYQCFLGEVQAAGDNAMRPLLDRVETMADDPADWRYRLARGMQSYLRELMLAAAVKRRRDRRPPNPGRRAWMDLIDPETG